jgi:hypothetical protein
VPSDVVTIFVVAGSRLVEGKQREKEREREREIER